MHAVPSALGMRGGVVDLGLASQANTYRPFGTGERVGVTVDLGLASQAIECRAFGTGDDRVVPLALGTHIAGRHVIN